MLSHPLEEEDFAKLDPADFLAEWKWDGIRLQASCGRAGDGRRVRRIYSRTGEDVSSAFPDLVEALDFEGALDGELLIVRDGRVQSFNVLQQRLNRKTVTPKLLADFPAHLRVYDILAEGEEDLRAPAFRRAPPPPRGVRRAPRRSADRPLAPRALRDLRRSSRRRGPTRPRWAPVPMPRPSRAACSSARDSPYLPGRPKGYWYKWKRDPYLVDAVMMYGQRGHGKRSSFYSDYTFGVWRDGPEGEELVPVGKAYHGFTDEELAKLDRYVRNHTVNRFGPVREVAYGKDRGLVLEVAFEGLQRSTRHKSGVAMRFPRINRIRWDKPAAEADRLETLEAILRRGETRDIPVDGQAGGGDTGGAVMQVETSAEGGVTRQASGRLVVRRTAPASPTSPTRSPPGSRSSILADGAPHRVLPSHLGLADHPGERRPRRPPRPR